MSNFTEASHRYEILESLSSQGSEAVVKAQTNLFSGSVFCVIQRSWVQEFKDFEQISKILKNLSKFPQLPKFIEAFTNDKRYYFVQQFVEGKSLETTLGEGSLFNPEQVIQFLTETLLILELLHDLQIVHGDFKPKNLIYNQQWILVDFSSAYLVNHSPPRAGDAQYAAPEQIKGQENYSSDLYSLGIICWQLLTRLSPFNLLNEPLPSLESFTLNSILQQLVEPTVEARFQSASQVLQSLQNAGLIKQQKSLGEQLQPTIYSPDLSIKGISGTVNAIKFNPNGRNLASGGDDKILHLWDIKTATKIGDFQGEKQPIKAITFIKNGDYLVTGNSKGLIEIWDRATQKISQSFLGHNQAINALVWDQEGKLLTASADKTVKRWDLETGTIETTYKGHLLSILDLATQGNLLATASQDRTIKLWEIDQEKPFATLAKHTWPVKAVALSPNGEIVASGGDDNQIILWDVKTQEILQIISGHSWSVTCLAFLEGGEMLISGSWDKTLKIWQVATGQLLGIFTGHSDCIYSLAIHPVEPIIASAGKDKTINLWSIRDLTHT
jgi:WD40 repeat protein